MADWYFSEAGDIRVGSDGDIAVTDTAWRDDAQQAYIRIKTEPGDFVLYPNLGADLDQLRGMRQSESTGAVGKQIIKNALETSNAFLGRQFMYKAVPTGPQTIRFDVFVINNNRDNLILSIEQDLGIN
jgi:hypothetical protein